MLSLYPSERSGCTIRLVSCSRNGLQYISGLLQGTLVVHSGHLKEMSQNQHASSDAQTPNFLDGSPQLPVLLQCSNIFKPVGLRAEKMTLLQICTDHCDQQDVPHCSLSADLPSCGHHPFFAPTFHYVMYSDCDFCQLSPKDIFF